MILSLTSSIFILT